MAIKITDQTKELLLLGPCPIETKTTLQRKIDSMPIVAVDGGVNHLDGQECFSIGDGDSSNAIMTLSYPSLKDESDLNLALKYLEKYTLNIHAYGFLGLRRDHEWINLGEFTAHVERTNSLILLEERTLILPKGIYEIEIHGIFSLLSLYENQISLSGECAFGKNETFELRPLSSRGLSNSGSGIIKVKATRAFIIYTVEQDLTFPKYSS